LGSRRLSTAFRKVTGTIPVTTRFKVNVPDSSTATALATKIEEASTDILAQTDSAMAAADWSGEPVITAAPTMTAPTLTVVVAPTPTCAKHQWYDTAKGVCENCPAGLDASEDKTHCVDPVVGGFTELQIALLGLGASALCGCLSVVAAFAPGLLRPVTEPRLGRQSGNEVVESSEKPPAASHTEGPPARV